MREPRAAVMTMVEASWQDEAGALQTASACMEVKSAKGACIRLKKPIAVGSKLNIQWRFERFSGVARNCRSEGREYLIGIQRETGENPIPQDLVSPAPTPIAPPRVASAPPVVPLADRISVSDPPLSVAAAAAAWTAKRRSQARPQTTLPPESKLHAERSAEKKLSEHHLPEIKPSENQPQDGVPTTNPPAISSDKKPRELLQMRPPSEQRQPELPLVRRQVATVDFQRIPGRSTPLLTPHIQNDSRIRAGPYIPRPQPTEAVNRTGIPEQAPKGKDPGIERKRMRPKWLGLAPWQNKQDDLSESRNGNSTSHDEGEKENLMPHVTPPAKRPAADSAGEDSATFQVDLLPMEDIYRTAGILSPPKGYGIKKVVDMLNSEYVRALSKDMKRAAILMALDAAGVPISQLQQDAKSRQEALDSYEAAQRKQVEAEWARKTEENVQIQAEMERVKAHHMARIARNLDAIAREKATFSTWLAVKQEETSSMLEAAELCLKASSEPVGGVLQAKSDAEAKSSAAAKDLLSEANLAKAASAGSKPM